ncbi:MAG: glucan biosynthesis protein [Proteobacteria bacterium]|nr:glucan biosynthesis protein [Pseudomonadota bacterium]
MGKLHVLISLACLLAATAFASPAAAPEVMPQGTVDFEAVKAMAAKLAAEPYREPAVIQGDLRKLSYDQYRALRSRPDTALWRDGNSLFHVEFFPAGFIYDRPVQIDVVDKGASTPVAISPDQFDFSDTGLKQPPRDLALAGFRITYPINRPDKFDEVISFLGASYFRTIGRGQVYGASARGLAINTGIGEPEQFPIFRQFWLVKPADGANEVTVWALLDAPDATGAFAFVIRPGGRTVVDTHAFLYMRNDVKLLAIAPLTSMFFAGKMSPPRDDYRPEIHDSDGLYIATGSGERIWRPLSNPSGLAISSFTDTNPRGFGLMQRDRDFEHYQDSGAQLQARPSLWVEPEPNWGDGEVRLVEIPSPAETNDNIVALWVSRWPARKGETKEYKYRLSALDDEAALSPLARVVSTRSGVVPAADGQRRYVVEFAGSALDALAAEQPVSADVSLSSGKLLRTHVERVGTPGRWRVVIDFQPDGKKSVDLRASLALRGQKLTETWAMVWRP